MTFSTKPTELAYLAGFIDGEGCFFIGQFKTKARPGAKVYPNYHTLLCITNTDKGVLEWIHERFGGTLDKRPRETRKSGVIRDIHRIVFTGNLLTDLTEALLPYLVYKKPHALIMLEMRSTFARVRKKTFISEETTIIRQNCFQKLRQLNSRFHNHPIKSLPLVTLSS